MGDDWSTQMEALGSFERHSYLLDSALDMKVGGGFLRWRSRAAPATAAPPRAAQQEEQPQAADPPRRRPQRGAASYIRSGGASPERCPAALACSAVALPQVDITL